MSELIEGLYKRGYRKFAYLAGVEGTLDNKERYSAMMDILSSHDIKIPQSTIYTGITRNKAAIRQQNTTPLKKTA